jgi:hypothetical protein
MAKKFDFLSPGIEIREIDQSFIPAERDAEGPIIIGRTRKGPANKPVRVRNLDDFVSVFGLPVPGGNGIQGDMWRDGNTSGPTYASYAAQAWLASEESPVTIVRLAGEQSDNNDGTDKGMAGWKLDGLPNVLTASNSTAYGLFLIHSSSTNKDQTGSLGAVFYANAGALALCGTNPDLGTVTASCALVANVGSNSEFKMQVFKADGSSDGEYRFDFNRNSSKYIRSVFNTNPQMVNADTVDSAQLKTYWLGESFARNLLDNGSLGSGTTGTVYGMLLPLHSTDGSITNWSSHKESAQEAMTGWIVCQQEKVQQDIFRLKSLHVGEEIQKNYMIAIEDIREPSNPIVNAFGTFTVAVKTIAGETVERYTGLNLNPSSTDFIGKRIGDQYQTWSETDKRYRSYGDFKNNSDIVYVEIKQFIKDGAGQGLLPAGFKGPVRPKAFAVVSGSANFQTASVYPWKQGTAFAGVFAKGSGSAPLAYSDGSVQLLAGETTIFGTAVGGTTAGLGFSGSFEFPSVPLRANGTEGGAPNPYRAYYGIRPKISDSSTTNDPDYIDYTRRLPTGYNAEGGGPTNSAFEHSFIFTLDDLIVATGSNVVTYTSGTYATSSATVDGGSYTRHKSFGNLLDLNVRQFLVPLVGGSDGLDITEKEPFRADRIDGADSSNAMTFTLNKALDSVLDPELVPANLLLVPGISKPVITNRIISTAESRKDVLALIDLEGDYTPSAERLAGATDAASLGSVDSAVSSLKTRNLNSSYAAAFYPWVQITDNLNASNLVWIPPSVAALGALGKSQAQSELWFAPAGFNRGGLGSLGGQRGPRVVQARQRLDSKERDSLYEVNINPIATFPAEGVVIFGQKTLQADQSALDRINVRRLVLYLKSAVSTVSRSLLFDQNVQSTWNRFKAQVNPILSSVQSRFGLSDYKLILDDSTTTADLIDRNIMYAKIYIKPARAIEYIVVDFVITKTGADFV